MSGAPGFDRPALIRAALDAREQAYAPYSGFCVGAALLAENGRVYTGCNIECASYSPTNCAERTALFKAVSEGERRFEAIAVAGGKKGAPCAFTTPCGVCRQMLYEFGGPALRVVMAKSETDWREMALGELLPLAFGPADIGESSEMRAERTKKL